LAIFIWKLIVTNYVARTEGQPPNLQQPIGNFTKVSHTLIQVDGKPILLMFSALYCPFCAAERWPIKIATERFGKWKNLKGDTNGTTRPDFNNVPTYDFYHAKYTSDYITFIHNDYADKDGDQLQKPDSITEDLVNKYDSGFTIPFIMIGGQYGRTGPAFSPGLIQGKSFSKVEDEIKSNPNSQVTKAVNYEADFLTAYLCKMTNGRPSSTCDSSNIRTYISFIQ
jgi:thiol-disulfide isomerase/thioredoxin